MSGKGAQDALIRLGLLLQLQRRARDAEEKELPFIAVNETRLLIPYRQAVLWQPDAEGKWKVTAVSGLSVPDPGAPFVQWLGPLPAALNQPSPQSPPSPVRAFTAADIPEDAAAAWQDWLPAEGMLVPLAARKSTYGLLALFRDEPFGDKEKEFASHLAESYGQSFALARRGPSRFSLRPALRNRKLLATAALILVLLFPVRESVLAPGEVIPLHPAHIRVGLDGIIESIAVRPNQNVAKGDTLFRLEDTNLRTRFAIAAKDLEVAVAELQQTQQMSLMDPRAKIRLPMLQGRVDQLVAERELVASHLAKVVVTSPADGIAVFDDPDAWLGRPVSTGQKVLEVADPALVQLKITLPMGEALTLTEGDSVLFFPNIRPHSPVSAKLAFVGYQAAETPEAGVAFTLRAHFTAKEDSPRLGLRGTAKLYGSRSPVIFQLVRRPILQLRQWLGV